MIILEGILSQEIIQKLGWTLVHFIWQAAVAALLLATLLKLLRKSTANLRYIIACMALGLIVLLPVITIQLVPVSAPHMAANIEPAPVPTVLPTLEMPAAETTVIEKPSQSEIVTPASSVPWKQRAIETLEPGLPYIVSGWLIGVFALSIWHLGGWAQLQRLKRKMVRQVDDTLHSKLSRLAKRLRVSRTMQLMESALVQIPTVVGWLRPVILLPASALTGLTSEQLEAILAHELAHVKRYDYLVNILQTAVEILGFYHPAVWWVSHKIRAERENCCDDLAVSISGDRVCYARALTSMEEIRAARCQLAVAASGGNLFRRIYRLLGKDSAEKTGFSWIPAATVILLILALVIPTALSLTNKSTPLQAEPKTSVLLEDTKKESVDK
jgi:beta-lactamase regulating signal transducer with metallopeptidase domain